MNLDKGLSSPWVRLRAVVEDASVGYVYMGQEASQWVFYWLAWLFLVWLGMGCFVSMENTHTHTHALSLSCLFPCFVAIPRSIYDDFRSLGSFGLHLSFLVVLSIQKGFEIDGDAWTT
jgi:hypothetical protein